MSVPVTRPPGDVNSSPGETFELPDYPGKNGHVRVLYHWLAQACHQGAANGDYELAAWLREQALALGDHRVTETPASLRSWTGPDGPEKVLHERLRQLAESAVGVDRTTERALRDAAEDLLDRNPASELAYCPWFGPSNEASLFYDLFVVAIRSARVVDQQLTVELAARARAWYWAQAPLIVTARAKLDLGWSEAQLRNWLDFPCARLDDRIPAQELVGGDWLAVLRELDRLVAIEYARKLLDEDKTAS
jgi:hypothetical protein